MFHILKKFLGFSFELTIVHGKRKKNRDEKFMHYLESKIAGMVPRTRRLRTAVSPSRIRALYYIRSGGLYGRHLLVRFINTAGDTLLLSGADRVSRVIVNGTVYAKVADQGFLRQKAVYGSKSLCERKKQSFFLPPKRPQKHSSRHTEPTSGIWSQLPPCSCSARSSSSHIP